MELAVNYDIKVITFHGVKDGKTLCGRKINYERKKTDYHQGWIIQQGGIENITCKQCKRIAFKSNYYKPSINIGEQNEDLHL
jgi:hypothetical protein